MFKFVFRLNQITINSLAECRLIGMGGKSSKSSLSVEDLAFLVTNTNLPTEEIQVRRQGSSQVENTGVLTRPGTKDSSRIVPRENFPKISLSPCTEECSLGGIPQLSVRTSLGLLIPTTAVP